MILQTNGQEAELLSFVPGAQTVHLETAEPMELGEALEVWTELEAVSYTHLTLPTT